jgi:16S rRNA processing protein RimM
MPADLVELGRISGAYGIRGWVKVQPHSADAGALTAVKTWWLAPPPAVPAAASTASTPATSFEILTVRSQGSAIVAQLRGVADREQAERMRGMRVSVPRSAFPAPEEDEYYWVDLIGCTLYGVQGDASVRIGRVEDVLDNGAHAVLRVVCLRDTAVDAVSTDVRTDAKGRPVEELVPFVRAHITAVDLQARRIDSDWPLEF